MPHLRHGDIFDTISNEPFDLAMIFGYWGFNEIQGRAIRQLHLFQELFEGNNPFEEFGFENPLKLDNRCQLVFVREEENHGISDERLVEIVSQIEDFIQIHGVRALITNGVKNTDHGGNPVANQASDDRRAQLLIETFSEMEERLAIDATLISLDDVFTRQPPIQNLEAEEGGRYWVPEEFFENTGLQALLANVILDRELWPEVRKGRLTVYYRGAALIRDLRIKDGRIVGQVHYKYVPIRRPERSDYTQLALGEGGLDLAADLLPLSIGIGSPEVLTEYKRMMRSVGGKPECQIIHQIVCRPENRIIDQEKKFQIPGVPLADKIDICHWQRELQCLSFVEVKGVHDPRLRPRADGVPEVIRQLERYAQRIANHRDEIVRDYNAVVAIKRRLGMGNRLEGVPETVSAILKKPILVVGGCSEDEVAQILGNNAAWTPLMEGLLNVAAGLILCGKNGCRLDLPPLTGGQVVVFDRTVI